MLRFDKGTEEGGVYVEGMVLITQKEKSQKSPSQILVRCGLSIRSAHESNSKEKKGRQEGGSRQFTSQRSPEKQKPDHEVVKKTGGRIPLLGSLGVLPAGKR